MAATNAPSLPESYTKNLNGNAFDALVAVADRFCDQWRIPYALACACAQLGKFEDSKAWFQRAMTIDEETGGCGFGSETALGQPERIAMATGVRF